MDTKFSVALHILIYISETDKVVSSELLAKSVNTNSSHIRKILAVLKKRWTNRKSTRKNWNNIGKRA